MAVITRSLRLTRPKNAREPNASNALQPQRTKRHRQCDDLADRLRPPPSGPPGEDTAKAVANELHTPAGSTIRLVDRLSQPVRQDVRAVDVPSDFGGYGFVADAHQPQTRLGVMQVRCQKAAHDDHGPPRSCALTQPL